MYPQLHRQRQMAYAGACINQGIVIQQKSRGVNAGIYSARCAQDFDVHDSMCSEEDAPCVVYYCGMFCFAMAAQGDGFDMTLILWLSLPDKKA